jgi:hypothetical protein
MKLWRDWPWRRLAAGVVVVLVLLAAYSIVKSVWRQRLVRAEVARIRAAGEAVTTDDIAAAYRIPAGAPNATPAWRLVFQTLGPDRAAGYPDFGLGRAGAQPPAPPGAWKELEAAQQFVANYAPLYGQIEAAVKAPGECEYLTDFSRGYQTSINFVQHLVSIRRLLVLWAFVRVHEGDASGAASDLRAVLKTTETLAREWGLGSQLTRLASNQAAVRAIERLLPGADWDDAELAALENALLAIDYHAGMALMVQDQRVDGLLAFEDASTAGARYVPTFAYRAWTGDDPLTFLETYRELLEATRGPWPAPLVRTAKFKAKSPEDLANEEQASALVGGSWVVPSRLAGLVRWQIEQTARETARLRAAAAGLAALRFRRAEGRWPRSLEELVPSWLGTVPLDPYTGKPLLVTSADDGVVVYSVGLNGRDDGGVETPEVDQWGSHFHGAPDVAFRVGGGQVEEE